MNNWADELRSKLRNHRPVQISAPDRIAAAVLVPFFEKNGEPYLIFTKRTSELRYHQGEICFPGGTREEIDPDLKGTALRELEEEIAVPPNRVEIVGVLDTIKTVSSYFLVIPYVGVLRQDTRLIANRTEVEEILEIPFCHFLDPSIFREEMRDVDSRPVPVYYYQWQSYTIWGLTGRILKQLLELLIM